MNRASLILACSVLLLAACGDDERAGVDASVGVDAAEDPGIRDVTVDATDAPDVLVPGFCEEAGLESIDFQSAGGTRYGEVAGDFTVNLLDGTEFVLSEEWTGCESYVFINYFESDVSDELWGGIVDPLLKSSPLNVHYFFGSFESEPGAARARVEAMAAVLEASSEFLTAEELAFWTERVHFIVDPMREVTGSIGPFLSAQAQVQFAFAIDRAQRFDPVGSLAQIVGGRFAQRLQMAAFAPQYFNYRAELDARLASEADVTEIALVAESEFGERVFEREASLPNAAAMAAFDTLEVDVSITCHLGPADCSEWDRIARIGLCTDAECSETRELVRWITPYSRPGRRRWAIDASSLLGLLRPGGTQRFKIELGPDWEEATERDVAISFRLSRRDELSASGAELAFVGGAFDGTYNDSQAPFSFTPPARTSRVELVVILSGHGQTDEDNCAEWCNHVHDFVVNDGAPNQVSFEGQAGQRTGCAELASSGVVPGQYGNWAPLRAGWCPGYPVNAVRMDITDQVSVGSENTVSYRASFGGGEPRGGDVALSAYIAYFQ